MKLQKVLRTTTFILILLLTAQTHSKQLDTTLSLEERINMFLEEPQSGCGTHLFYKLLQISSEGQEYPIQDYEVETEDGYINTIFRVQA
jgi:Partial alpha/beta-hydrolase lipase region